MSAAIATLAAWVIGANLFTAQPMPSMDSHTLGLYVTHEATQLSGGVLRNGNGHANAWAGRNFSTPGGALSLTLGAVAGVQRSTWTEQRCKTAQPSTTPRPCFALTQKAELLPLVAASARVPLSASHALRLSAWPVRTDAGLRGAVTLSLEVAL
jgi:hypothetical protein